MLAQSVREKGGYRIPGRDGAQGEALLADAQALGQAGAFGIVLELVTPSVAAEITAAIGIPTIGIGSGGDCDGQILVTTDLLGTSPDSIDLAEDRERFKKLVDDLGLKQPVSGIAASREEAYAIAAEIGFPVVIRPSYVLGGRAMEIVRDTAQLTRYIAEAVTVSGDSPVLLDSYLSGAIECDVDAICDGKDVHVAGIMQHIEEAGVHSGDSACSLPPYSLPKDIIAELHRQTEALALALGVVGLMNVQFAVKDGEIYLIEVNPRASRTVPFVAKATDSAIAAIAARVMAGEPLSNFPKRAPYPPDAAQGDPEPIGDPMRLADPNMPWFSVKEAVLPFARFPGVDTLLGPEMRSTGEVMGWDQIGRAHV